MSGLNTLDRDNIIRQLARISDRLAQVERMLQGQPIDTVRIADAAITDAKIVSLAAEKIIAGDLIVAVDVGNPSSGYVRLDGVNNRIVINDGTTNRVVLGEV